MVDFKHGKIQLKASSNDCASGIQQPFLLLRSQYIVFPAQLNGLFIQVMLDTGFSQYEGLSKERNLEELTQSYYLADHSKTEEYEKFLDEEEKITNASDDEVFPSKRFRSRIWLSRTRFEQLFDAQDTYTFEKKTVAFGRSAVRTEQVSPGVLFEFVGRQFKRTRCHEYPALDKSISLSVGMRVDAIVGMNTLATAKRVTIDFPRRVLWIEW